MRSPAVANGNDGHQILLPPRPGLLLVCGTQRSPKSSSITRPLTTLPIKFFGSRLTCPMLLLWHVWSVYPSCHGVGQNFVNLHRSNRSSQVVSFFRHFLSLPLHTISPPSFPSSLISLPSTFENSTCSKKWNAAAAHFLKYLYFSFLLYRLS